MGKKADLTDGKKGEIRGLLTNTTLSMREIARRTFVSNRSVRRVKEEVTNSRQNNKGRQNCHGKRITSARTDGVLTRSAKKSPWTTVGEHAKEVRHAGISVSSTTVWRRLKEAGFKSVKPVRKPQLTKEMKKKRFDWAKRHRHWTVEDWKKVRSCQNSS